MENGRYRNDPITEALLEIRLVPGKSFDAPGLQAAFASLLPDFPRQNPLVDLKTQISLGQQTTAKTEGTIIGIACFSSDEKRKIEARQDGVTFGQLAPYRGWNEFRSESRRFWDLYRPCVEPNQITQISLRYVNRFNIPNDSSLDKFFNVFPLLSEGLIGRQLGFFLQTQLAWDELQVTGMVNQATIDSGSPDYSSMLLDIGIVRASEIGQNDEELWDIIEKFRDLKNEIFESIITDTTREMLRS